MADNGGPVTGKVKLLLELSKGFGGPDCQCGQCKSTRRMAEYHNCNMHRYNHGPWLNGEELRIQGYDGNRMPIPGDADYVGPRC